jgi:hypothetical protein
VQQGKRPGRPVKKDSTFHIAIANKKQAVQKK